MTPARRLRKRYAPQPSSLDEPIYRIPHLPILIFCTILACVLLLPAARTRTHSVEIDLPWVALDELKQPAGVEVAEIRLRSDGRITFNDAVVTHGDLVKLLHAGLYRSSEPYVIFTPAPDVSYDSALNVLAIIKASGVTKFCFGGLQKHRDFGKSWMHTPMTLSLVEPPPDPDYRAWPAKTLDCGPTVSSEPIRSPIIPAAPPPA